MSILDFGPGEVAEPLLIPAAVVAEMMQISVRTLWRLTSAKRVPAPLRIGGTVRWRLDEIKKWIAEGCLSPQSRDNEIRRK
jgi:predicted DNA-binding transcriptional regulator AlpA